MKTQFSVLPILVAICGILLLFVLFNLESCKRDPLDIIHFPEYRRIKEIKPISVSRETVPQLIKVSERPDTLRRAKKEKEKILTGVQVVKEKNRLMLNVQTLDPLGISEQKSIEVLPGEVFSVDDLGKIEMDDEKRKKIIKGAKVKKVIVRVLTYSAIAGAFVAGVFVAK